MEDRKKQDCQKLIDAFSDTGFQEKINQYRYEIEQELVKFIEWLLTALEPRQKIFHSPESRIKSKAGFAEKISRKDYVHKWTVDADRSAIQEEILAKLPDLIGFRITCFFMDDEEVIYNRLKEYYAQGKLNDIRLDFDEGTKQKNGHMIFKVSGLYQNRVSFELQIKAMVHNIWGEVEHKTIYKGTQYTMDLEQRRTITEEIFHVLKASDQQLLSLFTHQYTVQDLVCGLFAEQTRQNVAKASGTEYLAGHYKSFFDIFLRTAGSDICSYVSSALVKQPFKKRQIGTEEIDGKTRELAGEIKAAFLEYYLQIQYIIAQELYDFKDFDRFLLYMADILYSCLSEDEDSEMIDGDAFFEEEEAEDLEGGQHNLLLDLLKDKLPDAYR